jgi:secreted PhoX family phosphatase
MKFKSTLVCYTIFYSIAMMTAPAQSETRSISRIATMPAGAEVTGLSANALGELFLNAQHPGGDNYFKEGAPAAQIGYMRGFDSQSHSGGNVPIPGAGEKARVNLVSGSYDIFGKAGDKLGTGQVLGGVYDISGSLMYVSNAPDFNGFVPVGANMAYLYTGWEGAGRDGASAVSKIALKRTDGKWQADLGSSKMLDLSSVDGLQVVCSGIVTPWGTPLMAEEYFFYDTSVWNHPDNHDDDEKIYFMGGNDISYIKPKNMNKYLGRMSNPYRYGYMVEINSAASQNGEELVKHFATGRLSHETAAVMADMKTVYMTDDDSGAYKHKKYNTASGGVLFKFVADHKGDLSSGRLYAAKLEQDKEVDPNKTGFNVSWIVLGHSTNAQIGQWIAEYDSVKLSDYVEGQSSYISATDVNNWAEGKTGKDLNGDGNIGNYNNDSPAFLESRRAAAALGATNEWDKLEGVSANGDKVYIAASAISFTMDKSWGHIDWATGVNDKANSGAIALNAEGCGGTYVGTTDANYSITRIEPYVIGKTTADGKCDNGLPANPDNILALSDGSVLIGEDAGKEKHPVDMLWMVK